MTTQKKQHYVSQFFMRNFSRDSSTIRTYIINNDIHINSSIRDQAQNNKLYTNELELFLGNMESEASESIKYILLNDKSPIRFSLNHLYILVYTIIQYIRTPKIINNINEHNSRFTKMILLSYLKLNNIDVKETDFEIISDYDFSAYIINILVHTLWKLVDLEYKIIKNDTDIPFIISDNPAVHYNMLYEKYNYNGGNGLYSKGFQIILPLSEKHVIIFYDRDIYKIGSNNNKIIKTNDNNDINNINRIQYMNAINLIMYSDSIYDTMIKKEYKEAYIKYHKYDEILKVYNKSPNGYFIKDDDQMQEADPVNPNIYTFQSNYNKCKFSINCINYTKLGSRFRNFRKIPSRLSYEERIFEKYIMKLDKEDKIDEMADLIIKRYKDTLDRFLFAPESIKNK